MSGTEHKTTAPLQCLVRKLVSLAYGYIKLAATSKIAGTRR